jgi:DNA-directed RNA polymerase subunit RPC12/RpoP
MAKFNCKECGYRYEADSDQKGKKCPYCGKQTIIKEPPAEELVEES